MVSKLRSRLLLPSKDKDCGDLLADLLNSLSELQSRLPLYKDEIKIVVWTLDKRTLYIKFISASLVARQKIISKILYKILKEKKVASNIRQTISVESIPTSDIIDKVSKFTNILESTKLKCNNVDIVVSNNVYK